MSNKKLIVMSSIPDSAIDEMKELSKQWLDRQLTYLDQSFKLDEEFEQKLKKDEARWPNNQYLVIPRGCGKTGRLMKMLLENDESDWLVTTDEHIEKSIERRKYLMQMYKVQLVDMIFYLEDRNEFLLHNLSEVEKMYNKLKEEKEIVKHGHLIDLPRAFDPSERPVKCSVCGTVTSLYHGYKPRYCSDCGAKFDEEEEE